ncbi:hypothetical protein MRX96_048544 [Rhipicephalus microplus]
MQLSNVKFWHAPQSNASLSSGMLCSDSGRQRAGSLVGVAPKQAETREGGGSRVRSQGVEGVLVHGGLAEDGMHTVVDDPQTHRAEELGAPLLLFAAGHFALKAQAPVQSLQAKVALVVHAQGALGPHVGL